MTPEDVLARLLETAPRVLRIDLAELSFDGLDALTAERLRRHARRRSRGMTVDKALRKLPAPDRVALAAWIAARHGWSDLGLEELTFPDLKLWAHRHDLLWALEIGYARARPANYFARFVDGTIEDVIAGRSAAPYTWGGPRGLRGDAIDFLTECYRVATELRAEEPGVIAGLAEPPAVLRGVWGRALTRYRALRARHAPAIRPGSQARVELDPPHVAIEVFGQIVSFHLERPLPVHPVPAVEMAALYGLLMLLSDDSPMRSTLVQVMSTPQWRRDLDHVREALEAAAPLDEDRPFLVWEVSTGGGLELAPSLCRRTRTGGYLGRRVDAQDLVGRTGLTPVDARIVSLLHAWRRPPVEVLLEAFEALAGHPRVVFRGSGAKSPVPVRTGSLELALERDDEGIQGRFVAAGRALAQDELLEALHQSAGGRVAVARTDEILVVRCNEDQRQLVERWLARAPVLPHEALPSLLEFLPSLQARLPVSLGEGLRGRKVAGDERPVLRLRMEGPSLVIEPHVQPLPDASAQLPGEGPATLHVVRDGLPCFHDRDLGAEPGRIQDALRELGVPDAARQGPWLWAVDQADAALDVIRALDSERHRIEVDASLPQISDATSRELRLTLRSSSIGWFQVDGTLETDAGAVGLADVLSAAREGRRYVSVGKSRFVRLEETLLARVSALDAAGGQAGAPALAGVHAPLLEAFEDDGALVAGPKAWKETVTRLRAARDADIELPDGLLAELRSYQREGFTWLARQAEWAPGCVLADDMGLGKTVQAIALLLRRRALGPALVVAPTSLVFNWASELERFAPSLRVLTYTGSGRESQLDQAGPGDVVLTTYGVALRDAEALSARELGTLVLDEAQALKNPTSQRARAMRTLNAKFRLALSGTPVENHEIELWSLFAALVPGLFGPLARFRERFLGRGGRAALAAVVGPFTLRRTKRQVAPELPERQEVVQTLELSDDHRALYAAEVGRALERIHAAPPNRRFFQVGQELNRLRQLACEPRLADPGSPFDGPKVRWLVRNLRGVLEAGEQALVFSSYVTLLELARAELHREGIGVAWLTGSTPAPTRSREVARFQDGEVGVFLISLKAGGVGLNLTAASYVFILDPWWNPAAEDQAADRAHRIGQDKKVTIYKGVAAGTVEEKILTLQRDKREMVDELLSGSGSDQVLSASELMLLLSAPAPAPAEPPPRREAPAPLRLVQPKTLQEVLAEAREALAGAGLAESSRKVYGRALDAFARWVGERGAAPASDLGPLREAYREACERGELPPSRWRALLTAWKAAGLP